MVTDSVKNLCNSVCLWSDPR